MNGLIDRALSRARTQSDVILAIVMAAIVGSMIVPLPPWLLDVGIAINLAAALALLVAALYAKDALKVASFPTLLLITTLFRLSMNVSSTRLALSEGHAGEIIQAFGEFVVRGDYVVGAVIFLILTLVQFLVVAKGAERVAEVSARFTLDAMPGKQMSIDADLRAGAISQDQARAKRRELERESQLFGSMDGAMKFVKGDVIAGLVITAVNLVGGIVIGTLQNGMTAAEAASTYALISIGDGLVSQIPSLCIAVAAGLVVTRVASESEEASLGSDIGSQFFGQWKALFVVAGLCLLLALMPGMPHLTFVLIAAGLAAVGFGLKRVQEKPQATNSVTASAPASAEKKGPDLTPGVSPLTLDLSADLTWLVEELEGRFVKDDLDGVRERVHQELGVRLPGFRVRTGAPLPAGSWALSIDEIPAGRGTVGEVRFVTPSSVGDLQVLGISGTPLADSGLGRALTIVSAADEPKARAAQVPLLSARDYVCEHLVVLLRKRAHQFLGVSEVQAALNAIDGTHGALVKEALQKVPLPLMTDVLKKLLTEQVSVRNLRAILDALVSPSTAGDALQLADRCRQALSRQISHQYAPSGSLFAYLVDPGIEETLRTAGPAIDPREAGAILEGMKSVARQGRAVLLASPDVRRLLKKLVEGAFPEVAVLTFAELDPELQVRPIGRLAPVGQ
ncbi:MAG: FHIPEP family type III secretion protein [Myxococcaceae bacterium]|nr:FHIPEP family type III secretion protein [Myxococcaceae bacterium]